MLVVLGAVALVLSAVATSIGATVAFRVGQRARSTAENVEEAVAQATLEGRLDQLAESMRKSARLVEQVSAELDARAATARRLQEEAQTAEALAALHRDQAEAFRRMMDSELATAARGIRRDSIIIGVASFVTGSGVTFLVTLLVHPLH